MESIQIILVVSTKSFKVELSAGSDFVENVFTLFAHTFVKYLSNCLQNMFLFDCLGSMSHLIISNSFGDVFVNYFACIL